MFNTLKTKANRLAMSALLLTGALTFGSADSRAEPAEFVFDPTHTYITFFVSHFGYADLAGMFLESEGTFSYDEEAKELKSAKITVKTESVFTNHEKRDEHLERC